MLTKDEIEATISRFDNGRGFAYSGRLYIEALKTIVDLQAELDRMKAERAEQNCYTCKMFGADSCKDCGGYRNWVSKAGEL